MPIAIRAVKRALARKVSLFNRKIFKVKLVLLEAYISSGFFGPDWLARELVGPVPVWPVSWLIFFGFSNNTKRRRFVLGFLALRFCLFGSLLTVSSQNRSSAVHTITLHKPWFFSSLESWLLVAWPIDHRWPLLVSGSLQVFHCFFNLQVIFLNINFLWVSMINDCLARSRPFMFMELKLVNIWWKIKGMEQ